MTALVVGVPVSLAPAVDALLQRGVESCRRDRIPLPDDVVDLLAAIGEVAHQVRERRNVGVASLDAAPLPGRKLPAMDEFTVAEAAERLGVTRQAVEARCARGTLEHRRDGRRLFVRLPTPKEMPA